MTNDELQKAVEANTAAIDRLTVAVDALVSKFIRPNAQQALSNYERLERMEGIVEAIAEQQAVNTQQIAANAESSEAFDQRLEATRALVADNGSQIAQLKVLQQQGTEDIADLRALQDRNAQAIALMLQENAAFRESQQSQLAAIISNGRRLDQLEQKAS